MQMQLKVDNVRMYICNIIKNDVLLFLQKYSIVFYNLYSDVLKSGYNILIQHKIKTGLMYAFVVPKFNNFEC